MTGREQVCSNPNCHLWPKPHPLTLSCPPKPGREQTQCIADAEHKWIDMGDHQRCQSCYARDPATGREHMRQPEDLSPEVLNAWWNTLTPLQKQVVWEEYGSEWPMPATASEQS